MRDSATRLAAVGGSSNRVHQLDPQLPLGRLTTVKAFRDERYSAVFDMSLAALMAGAFALLLTCVECMRSSRSGVAQRNREIGIRRALGVNEKRVVAHFFHNGMRLALFGFAIGVPLGLGVMKILVAQITGIEMLTPGAVFTVVALLLGVAALASWLPARRASRIDPLDALRQE